MFDILEAERTPENSFSEMEEGVVAVKEDFTQKFGTVAKKKKRKDPYIKRIMFSLRLLFPVSIFVGGPAFVGWILAQSNSDDPCQKGTRGDLTLSGWLSIFALEKIFLVVGTPITLFIIRKSTNTALSKEMFQEIPVKLICCLFGFVIYIFDPVFTIIMEIWGIVLASTRENRHCIGYLNKLGMMSMFFLLFNFLFIPMFPIIFKSSAEVVIEAQAELLEEDEEEGTVEQNDQNV